jgi:hypothetical protein
VRTVFVSEDPADPLSDLLRHWARCRAPDDAEAGRLRVRVTAAVRDAAFLDLPPGCPMRPRAAAWARLRWFALGAAAAGLVVCLLPHVLVDRPSIAVREDSPEPLPPLARFQESQLTGKASLLAAAEELFNGHLAWVAEDGREVQLGLSDAAVPRQARPLAIRVVVLARKTGNGDWKPLWETDLVTHDEQLVELAPQAAAGARLRLWAHPLPDGMIAVDADFVLKGTVPLRSSSSGIQPGGVPQRVFSLQTDDAEYRIYQTVAMLTGKGSS